MNSLNENILFFRQVVKVTFFCITPSLSNKERKKEERRRKKEKKSKRASEREREKEREKKKTFYSCAGPGAWFSCYIIGYHLHKPNR